MKSAQPEPGRPNLPRQVLAMIEVLEYERVVVVFAGAVPAIRGDIVSIGRDVLVIETDNGDCAVNVANVAYVRVTP